MNMFNIDQQLYIYSYSILHSAMDMEYYRQSLSTSTRA